MAFQPKSIEDLTKVINNSNYPYELAVTASGGQGTSTDKVAFAIRKNLPIWLRNITLAEQDRLLAEEEKEKGLTKAEKTILEVLDPTNPLTEVEVVNKALDRGLNAPTITSAVNSLHVKNEIRWVAFRGYCRGGRP